MDDELYTDPEVQQIGREFEDGTRPIASFSYKLFPKYEN